MIKGDWKFRKLLHRYKNNQFFWKSKDSSISEQNDIIIDYKLWCFIIVEVIHVDQTFK